MGTYLMKIGDSFSQLLNVIFFNGSANESLSGRAWRTQSVWYKVIDTVFWFDKDHCQTSYNNDLRYARKLMGYE